MKNVHFQVFEDETNMDALNIELKGDLTIANTCIIKNELMKIIKSKTIINLHITDIIALDLAFYQLLFSLKLSLGKQKKALHVNMDIDDELSSLLVKSGFDPNFNQNSMGNE